MIKTVIIATAVSTLLACGAGKMSAGNGNASGSESDGTAQKKGSWKKLFDGKTTAGWHNYGKKTIGKAWVVDNGTLHLDASKKADWQVSGGGDILTDDTYENFELELEWKIAQNGNSGVIFQVYEDTARYKYPWMTGPEMQVLDNNGHPDAKIVKHRAGDLYDLITSSPETVRSFGEWNTVRIIADKGLLQFYLNGQKVVETRQWDDQWKAMIAGSKFKQFPGFGTYRRGSICLQDHGDDVWFRNIRIRTL